MADFDAEAARAAGHSDEEIARVQRGIAAARAAGYSDEEIRKHLGTGSGAQAAPAVPTPTTQSAAPPSAPPTDPGWSASRVLHDLGHYPALVAQAVGNAGVGLINTPSAVWNGSKYIANHYFSDLTDEEMAGADKQAQAPYYPAVDFGEISRPQNPTESIAAAGISGLTSGLLGGGLSRLPAVLGATGKEIAGALPGLLKDATTQGAIPGIVGDQANRNLDLDSLGPAGRTIVEGLIGATAAVAAHGVGKLITGDPVNAVATKLGAAENSDHAGDIAQNATRDWRAALPAKVEALKDIKPMPVTPEGDVTTDAMFGKVPLDTATVDMSETLKTVNAMSRKGGMVAPLLHEFGNDMPVKVKAILEDIAAKNNPIMEYPPKAVVTPSGPLRADTSPIVEGERGDLVKPPVSKLDRPAAGLLVPPTETPIAQPGVSPQTNPVQWRMENPGVAGIEPSVVQTNPQLPSVVTRNGLPTETVDPGMTGSKQLGEPRAAGAGASAASPPQGLAKMPGEPTYPPEYKNPDGTIVGFPLPLRDAMELRSYIGEMTSKGMMPKGSQAAQWDALYRGLSADLANTMERHGAGAEWNNYNTKVTKLYTDGAKLSKFSNDDNPGKDTANPGEAVSKLWNGMTKDSGDIATVREHLPEAADEIAAAFLRNKPEQWHRLSPEAQKALVPNPFDRLTVSMNAAAKPSVAEGIQNASHSAYWGLGGSLAENLLRPHYGAEGSTGLLSPWAWGAAAALAPPAARFLGRTTLNPGLLRLPAQGAYSSYVGANAGEPAAAAESPLLRQR